MMYLSKLLSYFTLACACFIDTAFCSDWIEASGSWNNETNWLSGVTDAADAVANFPDTGIDTTITLDMSPSLGTLHLTTVGGAQYTIVDPSHTHHLKFQGKSPAIMLSMGSATLDVPLMMMSPSLTVSVAGTGPLFFNQAVNGTGTFIKSGSGVLFLSGSSTYTGATHISAGTLFCRTANALPVNSAVIVSPGATWTLAANQSVGSIAGGGHISSLGNPGGFLETGRDDTDTTFSGVLSGSHELRKIGSGNLTLSGLNTYTGGTTVAQGVLQGTTDSLQGSIVNEAALFFNQATSGNFNGTLSGSGTVGIMGGGSIHYTTDHSTFSGLTDIQHGHLALHNVLGGSAMVEAAGVLSGHGTVVNDLFVKGTIAPETTLTVNGNYQQSDGSIHQVQLNGTGESSSIAIDGVATLDPGSEVLATTLDGSILTNHPYLILHAREGINGSYTKITSNGSPLLAPSILYDFQNAVLFFNLQFTGVAESFNQIQVANQLDSITNPTPAQTTLLNQFLTLAADPARLALDNLSAQQYTTLFQTAEFSNQHFIRRLFDPLRSILTRADTCCDPCDGVPIDTWFEASGVRNFYSTRSTIRGFKSRGYELSLGAQTQWNDLWTVGIAGFYEKDHIHYDLNGSGRTNNALGGIYALYHPCDYYILGDLVLGANNMRVKRHFNVGSQSYEAHSRPKIFQGALYFEAGKDMQWECLSLLPFIGIELDYYHRRHIHEKGTDPVTLFIDKKSRGAAFSRLGLHLAVDDFYCFAIALDAAWQYRLNNPNNHIKERFQTFGDTFTIEGAGLHRNGVDGAINVSREVCECWSLYAEVAGERWDHASSYTFLGGLTANW